MTNNDPRQRYVYIDIGEVIDPSRSSVDVTRRDRFTLFTYHPGTPVPTGIEEIAPRIQAGELWPWLSPWMDVGVVNLEEFKANPLRVMRRLAPHVLCLPTSLAAVPSHQLPPWRR